MSPATSVATTPVSTTSTSSKLPLFCSWSFTEDGKFLGASWHIDS